MDILLAMPGFLLAIAIIAALGVGTFNVVVAVGVFSIPAFARVARGSTLSVKQQEFVLAARALGGAPGSIMWRHILPNVAPPLVVQTTLRLATAILTASGLSFLGLGPQPPTPEWGAMLSGGRDQLRNSWWITTFPGLAIVVTVLAINLLGDGLRDALDPRHPDGTPPLPRDPIRVEDVLDVLRTDLMLSVAAGADTEHAKSLLWTSLYLQDMRQLESRLTPHVISVASRS